MLNTIYDDYSLDRIEINLKENESLIYFNLDRNASDVVINLANNSKIKYYQISLDEANTKLEVNLNGENASFEGNTLTILNNNTSKYDQNIVHNAKRTVSKIKNFGIVLDNANIDYHTVGKINKGMSGSNCNQTSRGVIIGNSASVTSEPILLIDEYDVFANHGAAIGKMSDDELFYLMSRGLNKKEALMLIIKGLINPIIDVLDDKYKEIYHNKIDELIKD